MTSRPPAHSLLARAHSPDSAARIFADNVSHRPLVLRATSPPARAENARAARRAARDAARAARRPKTKPKPLLVRERRRLGLLDVPAPGRAPVGGDDGRRVRRCREGSYAAFAALHALWLGYAREVLGQDAFAGGVAAAAKLAAAEFHGAEVEVVRSACVGRVGLRGFVVKDAKFSFEIVTPGGRVKVVPKEGTVFRVRIPMAGQGVMGEEGVEEDGGRMVVDSVVDSVVDDQQGEGVKSGDGRRTPRHKDGYRKDDPTDFVFDIHGDQFRLRSADRANRKYKQHFLKNL